MWADLPPPRESSASSAPPRFDPRLYRTGRRTQAPVAALELDDLPQRPLRVRSHLARGAHAVEARLVVEVAQGRAQAAHLFDDGEAAEGRVAEAVAALVQHRQPAAGELVGQLHHVPRHPPEAL